ncbi:DUF4153 domain-containing protein [Chryseobacterium sp. Mn2064]|uniref:DUF4153 domain-containing protein n=1 Tax=Chryseobacterium sp. Mn2064 TaxID=3395263 RepID=UPI003BC03F72
MKTKLYETLSKANEVIFRYPLVLIMASFASAGAIYILKSSFNQPFAYSKLTTCACLGISLLFAVKMLSQRIGRELLLQLSGIAFLVGFYFILPTRSKDFTEIQGYTIVVTFILIHLLVSFIPFLKKNRELGFWQYNKNLFVNFFLTIIFTGILTGGIELAFFAVTELFNLSFGEKIYSYTFLVLAIFGSTFIFLLFNEKGLNTLEKDGTYPVVLKFFTQFILIPLLLIYAVILYFYSLKILINWELPRGWVSYLILAYSMMGILALLLVHPLKEENAKSWVKIFSKVFYYTIIPLIVLLFTAIFTRILEYGYTEPRYFVLLLALWLLSTVIYFILGKKTTIKFIPVSLFAFGAFALIFPYFNAFSVAQRSQKAELLKILHQHQLLKNGKIVFQKKIDENARRQISDIFEFLGKRKQVEFLSSMLNEKDRMRLADHIESGSYYSIGYDIEDKFPNTGQHSQISADEVESLSIVPENQAIKIGDYQYFIKFPLYNEDNNIQINQDYFYMKSNLIEKPSLEIILNGKERIDFGPQLIKLFEENKGKTKILKTSDVALESNLGKYHIKLVFNTLNFDKYPGTNYPNIFFDNAYVLVRLK